MTTTIMSGSNQHVTFRVADLLFGIGVSHVQEVLRYQEMTPVPLAPAVVEGLINLRGQIVVAIDVRRSLGLPPGQFGLKPMNIVLHTPDGAVSLLVDEIHDVIDLPLNAWAPVPDNMPAAQRSLLVCVYNLADGLVLVLNTDQLLNQACEHELSGAVTSIEPVALRLN